MSETKPLLYGPDGEVISNNLAQALGLWGFNGGGGGIGIGGGINPFGFPGNQGAPFTEQLSNPATIFKSLRWYLVSNDRQFLCEAFAELGLVQTIVCVPVDDALRGGIEIKSSQLDEDDVAELKLSVDRDDDLTTAGWAAKWTRLFGGGGILILTDQDPMEPLDVPAINKDTPLNFREFDMWEMFWDKQNTEGYDPTIQQQDFEYYDYYDEKVHKSRVMRMRGLKAPSFIRPRIRGWGLSVMEVLVRSINQYLKATDLAFQVLDEFKIDVFKIKNLVNSLSSPIGMQKIQQRVQLANLQKNYQNALTMDSEDDWDHKQLSFAGIGEVMQQIRMQVASDMRMPMLKLFGTPSQGLNSSDEDSLEVYNAMVESEVRNKLKYDILRMLEIKCQKLFGMVPEDLSIEFKPLRVMSSEQEQTVKTQKFTRALQAQAAGLITAEEFRDTANKGQLFDITLDNSTGTLDDVADEAAEGEQDAESDGEGKEDPGANREDTKKTKVLETDPGHAKQKAPPRDKSAPEVKAKATRNSPEFDRSAYELEGGDGMFDPRKELLMENPGNVDESLWAKAKEASQKALGSVKWPFVSWWYKREGGKFN